MYPENNVSTETSSNVPNELVQRLERTLRDDARLNRLINERESSPAQLRQALEDSLDDWNTTPPPIDWVSFNNHPSRRLLIWGAVVEILKSQGILFSRNRLAYSDGGITVEVSEKAGEYMQWIGNLANDYERKKLELKKTINISRGWGAIQSEYAIIHGNREIFT